MLLKVINKKLPCQAVVNSMYVNETPTQLASWEKTRTSTNSSTHSTSEECYYA